MGCSCSALAKVAAMPVYGSSNLYQRNTPQPNQPGTAHVNRTPRKDRVKETNVAEKENIKVKKSSNKEHIKDLVNYLEDPNVKDSFEFRETPRRDCDVLSAISGGQTGRSFIFPDPSEIEILTHTPPSVGCNVRMEDTFWSGKRMLIPDYGVMEKIDEHVIRASVSLKNDPSRLVEYLMQPCKSDVEKARAIMRWLGENISFDTDYMDTGLCGGQSVEEVMDTGLAVCDGYATVFRHLAQLAGLECEKIGGQAKGALYRPGSFNPDHLSYGPEPHAWNAVKLDGQWYPCDVTWAAGTVASTDGKSKYKKEWNEMYFLPDPKYFILSHIPLKGDMILLEQQHIQKPLVDPSEWTSLALITPQAGIFDVKPISHQYSIIEAYSGEVAIKYDCSILVSQWLSIAKIETEGDRVTRVTGSKYDNMLSLFTAEGKSTIIARFKETGTYDIKVVGNVKNGHKCLEIPISLLYYRVMVTNQCKLAPLPKGFDCKWGIQKEFIDAGYRCLYPKTGIMKSTNGLAKIKIHLPTKGHLPNMHRLYYCDGQNIRAKMDEYVIAGQRGNIGTYYVQCPRVGEYRLEIFAKYENKDNGYYVGAAVLIKCKLPLQNPLKTEIGNSFLGFNDEFYQLGLVCSGKGTIVKVKDSEVRLRIKKNKPVNFATELKLISVSEFEVADAVSISENGDIATFTVKPPEKGFYVLTIYAALPDSESYPIVGRLGISYESHI